jgi:hypothetical protein
MSSTPAILQGGCFCGAIRYQANLAPAASMICHCRSCRRIAGAPAVAWLTFALDRFQYTQGKPALLQSSPAIRREFCSSCGTHLTYHNEQYPDEIDVTTCTLDDPSAFPPTHHSWLSHNIEWLRFGDHLPTYQKSRSSG